jgi:hypothetical protein
LRLPVTEKLLASAFLIENRSWKSKVLGKSWPSWVTVVVAKAKQKVLVLAISKTVFLIKGGHKTLPLLEHILRNSIVESKVPKFRIVIKIQEGAVFHRSDAGFENLKGRCD